MFAALNISKILKTKGFDEICFAYYRDNFEYESGEIYEYITPNRYKLIKDSKGVIPIFAPTLSQVCSWLKKKHNIYVQIELSSQDNETKNLYFYRLIFIDKNEQSKPLEYYTEHDDALINGIEEALKLI